MIYTEIQKQIIRKYGRATLVIENLSIKPVCDFAPIPINKNGPWFEDRKRTSKFAAWYEDLINRILPALGKWYMEFFIDCDFDPFAFLQGLDRMGKLKVRLKKIK